MGRKKIQVYVTQNRNNTHTRIVIVVWLVGRARIASVAMQARVLVSTTPLALLEPASPRLTNQSKIKPINRSTNQINE
jgi:hypothetical protein